MKTTLFELQNLLRDRFPEAMAASSDSRRLQVVQPTLQPGKLVEITGPDSGLLMHRFIAEQPCALIDAADAFEPGGLEASALRHLLWVRCQKASEAMRAADLLLRDGNLRVVLIDLRLRPVRELFALPSSVWHRLRLLAERGGAAVAVFSPCQVVACAAGRWAAPQTSPLTLAA
jgi:hypothetical protein